MASCPAMLVLVAILLPPVVPFATGHFWLFVLTTLLMCTGIGWPIASVISLVIAIIDATKPVPPWRHP